MDAVRWQPSVEVFQKSSLSLPAPKHKLKKKAHLVKSKSISSKTKGKSLSALRNKENDPKPSSNLRKPCKKLSVKEQQVQATTLHSDLKRVLGHSPQSSNSVRELLAVRDPTPSPSPRRVPFREIGRQLSEGLHPEEAFSESIVFLDSTKAEIRKIMKQSNPESFDSLSSCFDDSHTATMTRYAMLTTDSPPQQLIASPQCSLTMDPVPCDVMTVDCEGNTSPFQLNTLHLEPLSSFLESSPRSMPDLESSPSSAVMDDTSGLAQSDLLDLAEVFPSVGRDCEGWVTSPVKRPRLFPQKLY